MLEPVDLKVGECVMPNGLASVECTGSGGLDAPWFYRAAHVACCLQRAGLLLFLNSKQFGHPKKQASRAMLALTSRARLHPLPRGA